jgi:two-component system LytT family response regulator
MSTLQMRCLVVEDEDHVRKLLVEKLTHFEELEIIGEVASINDAFSLICNLKPEVAFMDVKIIGGDIFQLLYRLKQVGAAIPLIVVLTGFEEYAMQALNEYHNYIVQYLKKPFQYDWEVKFRVAIDALIQARSLRTGAVSLNPHPAVESKDGTSPESDTFLITNKQQYQRIRCDDVAYIEAAGSGATFVITNKETIKVDQTITKLLEKSLPPYFIRISKANAVNKNRILCINRNERTIDINLGDKKKQLGVGEAYYGGLIEGIKV